MNVRYLDAVSFFLHFSASNPMVELLRIYKCEWLQFLLFFFFFCFCYFSSKHGHSFDRLLGNIMILFISPFLNFMLFVDFAGFFSLSLSFVDRFDPFVFYSTDLFPNSFS